MKKILVLLFSIWLVAGHSQVVKPGFLAISPVHFFRNAFVATYETGIAKDKTILISPGVILKDNNNESLTGFTGEVQFRFYLVHPSFDKMDTPYGGARWQPYVAPYYQFNSIEKKFQSYYFDPVLSTSKEYTITRDITSNAGGILFGCRAVLTRNLFVDVSLGGGFRLSDNAESNSINVPKTDIYNTYDIFDYEYRGIAPKFALALGFRIY